MSKIIADYVSNIVFPLYGQLSLDDVRKYGMEKYVLSHIGSAIKIQIENRLFVLTAYHCIKKLGSLYPRVFHSWELALNPMKAFPFLPFKNRYLPKSDEYNYEEDFAFLEIDTDSARWKEAFALYGINCFNIRDCKTRKDKEETLTLHTAALQYSKNSGFIFGYPIFDAVDYDTPLLRPKQQLIPVKNIERINALFYKYEMELPEGFNDEKLSGMSGGALCCLIDNRVRLMGLHILGSNGIGHAITMPLIASEQLK